MQVHRSNRIEKLVDVLGDVVSLPLGDPMAPEWIAVQGRGMERWLSMRLSRRFGVWANPEFPFPRHLVQRQLRAVLGEEAIDPGFEPESLRWVIAARLSSLLSQPEFEALRRYLAADSSSFRLVQLAERIAELFDQYIVYRPEMILRWERGEDEHWQARLWRALAPPGAAHMAACARAFAEAVRRQSDRPPGLPSRISLFGLSTLAPLYLRILDQLSPWTDVHLFLLSPSREYWGQIRSQRESLRRLRADAVNDDLEETLRLDAGSPLLASLGKLGREFQEVLEASVDYVDADDDLYVEPGSATMLATLQSDMLALRYRSSTGGEPPLALADDSVQVHACHSQTREVEVLHEQLRRLFEHDRSLQPQDVIVMSPGIDDYAPLIEAVFDGAEDGAPGIPYRIGDRRLRSTEETVHAFLGILTAIGGRMSASEVVDLLELEPVRARFGIAAAQLDDVRAWIRGSAIRWGIDASHRREAEQPDIEANTWRFGLDRLLLGYAMPGGGRRMFAGVLPYDDIEGTVAATLGGLTDFCDVLFRYHRDFRRPRTLPRWRDDLERMLDDLVAVEGPRAYQRQQIRGVLADLARQAEAGGFAGEIDLETVRHCVEAGLEQQAPGRNFLAGGVTFCALVPMRTIPFEVVCLLGMNDDFFPRNRRPPAFDLMARKPRPGDRTSRDDDRYLFLEALLSARCKLIVTYVGQSVHDNAERPPSVVVSELLDTIDESFCDPPAPSEPQPARRKGAADRQMSLFVTGAVRASSRDRIVARHPLQPFSPRYFRPPLAAGLISYSQRHYQAARALVADKEEGQAPFVGMPLPALDLPAREVTIDQLVRFFENPARGFLQTRLSLFLGDDLDVLEDREPIELNHLEQWHVGNELLHAVLAGESLDSVRSSVVAAGWLPPGTIGTCALDDIQGSASAIAAATLEKRRGEPLPPLEVDTIVGDTRLIGIIGDRWAAGYSQSQYSKIGSRRELAVWLRHLIIDLVSAEDTPRESYLFGRGKDDGAAVIRFKPVANAVELLRPIVDLYWFGSTVALPLFERSSRAYAAKYIGEQQKGRSAADARAAALAAAIKQYEDDYFPDIDNPYVEQAFRDRQPVRDDISVGVLSAGVPASFTELALAIYTPFFDHREEKS